MRGLNARTGMLLFLCIYRKNTTVNSDFVVYFETSDLDNVVANLIKQGFNFTQMPTDETWLWREARLNDPDGNVICLYHAGDNRKNPPWRVK